MKTVCIAIKATENLPIIGVFTNAGVFANALQVYDDAKCKKVIQL